MMENFELMRKRLEFQGGIKQEDRMIKGKYETLKRALLYSYQGCDIRLAQNRDQCPLFKGLDTFTSTENFPIRALINPDRLKQDYDDKILSVDYAAGIKEGDVIEWLGTNSYWLVYLRALTEDAYFRAEIRRCKFYIKFKDENGNIRYTWAAIRGPVETEIDSIQKNQQRIDKGNLTLNVLVPNSPEILSAFDRYGKFIFNNRCWQVTAPDNISTLGVLEFTARENYINEDTDDTLGEVVDGLVAEKLDPNELLPDEIHIVGDTFIKPKISQVYLAPQENGVWSVDKCYPVCVKTISPTSAQITWMKSTSGNFTLKWSGRDISLEKKIVVESLF